ncbi:MAG TPA: hypothetical protein VK399_05590 [Longimicrobiaceae bacterium]|nr:hypothetical protein [Longimicrobiaceae bacterium]
MSEFASLLATVEQVRAERYPSLPADLVARILTVEAEHPGDRVVAMRIIKQLVLAALEEAQSPALQGASNA